MFSRPSITSFILRSNILKIVSKMEIDAKSIKVSKKGYLLTDCFLIQRRATSIGFLEVPSISSNRSIITCELWIISGVFLFKAKNCSTAVIFGHHFCTHKIIFYKMEILKSSKIVKQSCQFFHTFRICKDRIIENALKIFLITNLPCKVAIYSVQNILISKIIIWL